MNQYASENFDPSVARLLETLHREVRKLKQHNLSLAQENESLRKQNTMLRKELSGHPTIKNENERNALRHGIMGMIARIDAVLEKHG
jgi:regulator of replication initiation timing